MTIKTRSTLYLKQMNDEVKAKLEMLSKSTGIAQWAIVEDILEERFGIDSSNAVDVNKFLKGNKNKNKAGTRNRK